MARVLLDPAPAHGDQDQERAEEPGSEGAGEEGERRLGAGEQVGEADPRQGRVRQGVAEQALAAQQREAAEHAAEGAEQSGADQHVAGGEGQLHGRSSPAAGRSRERFWSRASVAWVSTVRRPP